MIIQGPKTIEDYEKIIFSIDSMIKNPYSDESMIRNLQQKRINNEQQIEILKKEILEQKRLG